MKKGNIKAHHFAHYPHTECTDSWHYDMSDWHLRWQSQFPEETQEIVFSVGKTKHRVDIFLKDKKTVIEFQHGPLSSDEFEDRNTFYNDLGFKIVWVFDLANQFENGSIENLEYSEEKYKWKHPKNTFNYIETLSNKNIALYFEWQNNNEVNDRFSEITANLKKEKEMGVDDLLDRDDELYYEDHKDNVSCLLKVSWVSPNGFERFAGSENHSETEFLSKFIMVKVKKKPISRDDIADVVMSTWADRGEYTFYGCPKTKDHLATMTECGECHSSLGQAFDYDIQGNLCKERFKSLPFKDISQIKSIERGREGRIKKIVVEENDQEKVYYFDEIPDNSASLVALWKNNKAKVMICHNLKTGYEVQITKDPELMVQKYKRIYGKIRKHGGDFSLKTMEIYGWDKPEWVVLWMIKND